jgi:transcriptional regulator
MYVPEQFRMADEAEAVALMRARPFATLVSSGAAGPVATHLPTVVRRDAAGTAIECHFSRANGHWQELAGAGEVLVIYAGAEAYIRPGWYASKAAHGKVVPTWNYAVVHAYGRAEIVEHGEWLARHVRELSDMMEAGYELPWSTADAPAAFVTALTRGIVGVRIAVTRLEAKAKMSQNREPADREGAAAGLEARGHGSDRAVARLIRKAGEGG